MIDILETVPYREVITTEDYRMAPVLMILSDLESHFCCF